VPSRSGTDRHGSGRERLGCDFAPARCERAPRGNLRARLLSKQHVRCQSFRGQYRHARVWRAGLSHHLATGSPCGLAFLQRAPLSPLAVAGAGLSAFGPLLAALLVAAPRGELRGVFRPWRTPPAWIALGLLAPLATHLCSIALYAVLIGPPAGWLHPPVTPEHVAALVVFSIGEEFGWRGFCSRGSRRALVQSGVRCAWA